MPFEKTQYYAYLKMLSIDNNAALSARTKNKKRTREAEEFIALYLNLSDGLNLSHLQSLIKERFECAMSISGFSKAILRIISIIGKELQNPLCEIDQVMTFFMGSLVGFFTCFVKNILCKPLMDIN